jgi:hypothetical protein
VVSGSVAVGPGKAGALWDRVEAADGCLGGSGVPGCCGRGAQIDAGIGPILPWFLKRTNTQSRPCAPADQQNSDFELSTEREPEKARVSL